MLVESEQSINEIRHDDGFVSWIFNTGFFACLDAFGEPGHIPRQRAHGLQAFKVLADIIGREAVNLIPVLGADNGHVAHLEIFVETVERGRSTAAAAGDDGSREFAVQAAVLRAAEGQSVKEARDHTRGACIVDRRADDDAGTVFEFCCRLIDNVIKDAVPKLHAFIAGNAVLQGLFAKPEKLGLYAEFREGLSHFVECRIRAAFFMRTAIY
jgi:hypothetical protein